MKLLIQFSDPFGPEVAFTANPTALEIKRLACWAQEQNGDNRTGANGRKDRSIAIMQSEQQGKELREKRTWPWEHVEY